MYMYMHMCGGTLRDWKKVSDPWNWSYRCELPAEDAGNETQTSRRAMGTLHH